MQTNQQFLPSLLHPSIKNFIDSLRLGDIEMISDSWLSARDYLENNLRWIRTFSKYIDSVAEPGSVNELIKAIEEQLINLENEIRKLDDLITSSATPEEISDTFNQLYENYQDLNQKYLALVQWDWERSLTGLPIWDQFLKLFPVWNDERRDDLQIRDMLIIWLREMADSLEADERWLNQIKENFPELEISDEPFQTMEALKLALGVFMTQLTEGNVPERDLEQAYTVVLQGSRLLTELRERVRELLQEIAEREGLPLGLLLLRRSISNLRTPAEELPPLLDEGLTWLAILRKDLSAWVKLPLVDMNILTEEKFETLNEALRISSEIFELIVSPSLDEETLNHVRELANADELKEASEILNSLKSDLEKGFNLREPLSDALKSLIYWLLELEIGTAPVSVINKMFDGILSSLKSLAVLSALKYFETSDEKYLDLLKELEDFRFSITQEPLETPEELLNLIHEILPPYKELLEKVNELDMELSVSEKIICPRCGAENSIDSKTCHRCGFMLNVSSTRKAVLTLNVRMPEKLEDLLIESTLSLRYPEHKEEALNLISDMISHFQEAIEKIDEALNSPEKPENSTELEILRDKLTQFNEKLKKLYELLESGNEDNEELLLRLSGIAESWKELAPDYFKALSQK